VHLHLHLLRVSFGIRLAPNSGWWLWNGVRLWFRRDEAMQIMAGDHLNVIL
jgi:hypothetical protein